MFNKLRNKFIILNLSLTAVILIISFVAIYLLSIRSADNRPPISETAPDYTVEVQNIIELSIHNEKQNAARELLTMLIVAGFAIEFAVGIISYFLAEEFIKPVKETYNSQKIFIANASHEIKTPLAAISANLEAADIKNNKWIDNISTETEKLTTLNLGLLNLARSDLIPEARTIETVNPKSLIETELELFLPRLEKSSKKITLSKKYKSSNELKISVADFKELFNILLDNALKYSKSKIIIEFDNHTLIVKNDGELIPEQSLPHLFGRFYQIDKSSEGVGLGLSIAKSLADRNKWELTAKTAENLNIFSVKF